MTERDEKRLRFIQALRDCADFLEAKPAIEVPWNVTMNVFVMTKDELATHARVAAWEKVYNDNYFSLVKRWGEELTLEINSSRETVCRKIVKGKRIVPARPEQTVDDIEWVCEDALLASEEVPSGA